MTNTIFGNTGRVGCLALTLCQVTITVGTAVAADSTGTLQIAVTNSESQPLPCRIHIQDASGQPVRPEGVIFWNDHFVCLGNVTIELDAGEYAWQVERGPEHQRLAGTVTIRSGETARLSQSLRRIATLRESGWHSGDMHVHRPVEQIEPLMRAEDLDFAPVITWWNTPAKGVEPPAQTEFRFDGHRIYTTMAGEDEREGGALLYFGLKQPLDLTVRSREFPSPMHFVGQARNRSADVWIDIEKPFWWDVPVWLATGQMNSIGLANNHMCRSRMYETEAWGRPRDESRLPAPRGNGFWTQEIYYHILNTGLRVPPSAGSASGVLPNPVGYNRVYVHLDGEFSRDAWFESLAAGRCFVTNGPLLQVRANEELPGTTFGEPGRSLRPVALSIELTSLDPIEALEIVQNGEVIKRVSCSDDITQQHAITFTPADSGWFLVRAITQVESTFRFASTGPWYLSPVDQPRICRSSLQFFLDWINERIERVEEKVNDRAELDSVLSWHLQARQHWRKKLRQANAE